MSLLVILKLTVTPLLVAGMSLAARRFGPTIGGLLMGLPWMTGPVLYFLALEKGEVYLAETARGALLAVPPIAAFSFVYVATARRSAWPMSLALAATAFAICGYLASKIDLPATGVAGLGVIALLTARTAIWAPAAGPLILAMPWWDIPARMVSTAALVAVIVASSDLLGPTLSGIVSSYPVILTVVGVFTHSRWGRGAVSVMLRGVMLSLNGFVVFFLLVAVLAPIAGVPAAYLAAVVTALLFNCALLIANRARKAPIRKKSGGPAET